jgi:hypothetical protein
MRIVFRSSSNKIKLGQLLNRREQDRQKTNSRLSNMQVCKWSRVAEIQGHDQQSAKLIFY